MIDPERPIERLLQSLQERAKELNCLYEVEQALSRPDLPLEEAFSKVVEAIPPGWQYPDVCAARIEYSGRFFASADFRTTEWELCADITVQDEAVGRIRVCYLEERPREDSGPFLREEERLVSTIAERLGHAILYHQLHSMHRQWEDAGRRAATDTEAAWREPMRLLRRTDRALYLRIARKMVNHLGWMGLEGAHDLLQVSTVDDIDPGQITRLIVVDVNRWERLDRMADLKNKADLEIFLWDHHINEGDIDANAGACASSSSSSCQ